MNLLLSTIIALLMAAAPAKTLPADPVIDAFIQASKDQPQPGVSASYEMTEFGPALVISSDMGATSDIFSYIPQDETRQMILAQFAQSPDTLQLLQYLAANDFNFIFRMHSTDDENLDFTFTPLNLKEYLSE